MDGKKTEMENCFLFFNELLSYVFGKNDWM